MVWIGSEISTVEAGPVYHAICDAISSSLYCEGFVQRTSRKGLIEESNCSRDLLLNLPCHQSRSGVLS
jgi:hypothetical protein